MSNNSPNSVKSHARQNHQPTNTPDGDAVEGTAPDGRLSQVQQEYVEYHYRTVLQLPAPSDGSWRVADLDEDLQTGVSFQTLREDGIIERVDRVKEHGRQHSIWRTRPGPYQRAREHADPGTGETLPCGHPVAFEHRDGQLHCKHPDCEASWPPSQLQAHLNGDPA